MKQRILIVEDEPSIMTLINYNLEQAGFQTEVAYDGVEAIDALDDSSFDLVVLDVMLPRMDGMEVCRRLRQMNNQIPVVMLSAKDTEKDKIRGLKMGADDYLTKPFSPKELIARIKAVLRRTMKTPPTVTCSGFSDQLGEPS